MTKKRNATKRLVMMGIPLLISLFIFSTQAIAASAPGTPVLTSAVQEDGLISLTWTAPSDGGSALKNYLVYRFTNGWIDAVWNVWAPATSAKLPFAYVGANTSWSVLAENAVGKSGESNRISVTPVCKLTTPTLTAKQNGTNVDLSWSAVSGISNYVILRFTNGTFEFAWYANSGQTSASLPYKTVGEPSGWQISAEASYCRTYSNIVTFTPTSGGTATNTQDPGTCTKSASYAWDESKNPGGSNRCTNDCQCNGTRMCSYAGWCN